MIVKDREELAAAGLTNQSFPAPPQAQQPQNPLQTLTSEMNEERIHLLNRIKAIFKQQQTISVQQERARLIKQYHTLYGYSSSANSYARIPCKD